MTLTTQLSGPPVTEWPLQPSESIAKSPVSAPVSDTAEMSSDPLAEFEIVKLCAELVVPSG